MSLPWILLLSAGVLEVGFTTFMKLSEGFSKPLPSIAFLVFAIGSFGLLSLAIKDIPLGTAYAVWTGIGAVGTVTIGMVFFKDPVSAVRIALLLILIGAILGLKFVPVASAPVAP